MLGVTETQRSRPSPPFLGTSSLPVRSWATGQGLVRETALERASSLQAEAGRGPSRRLRHACDLKVPLGWGRGTKAAWGPEPPRGPPVHAEWVGNRALDPGVVCDSSRAWATHYSKSESKTHHANRNVHPAPSVSLH